MIVRDQGTGEVKGREGSGVLVGMDFRRLSRSRDGRVKLRSFGRLLLYLEAASWCLDGASGTVSVRDVVGAWRPGFKDSRAMDM